MRGNPISTDTRIQTTPNTCRALFGLRVREAAFFARIGVDNLIAVAGLGQASGIDAVQAFLAGGAILGFDYDLDDLERIGVAGIEMADGS